MANRKPKTLQYTVVRDALPDAGALYWDLMHETLRDKTCQRISAVNRSTLGCYQERALLGLDPASLLSRIGSDLGLEGERIRRPRFSPTVGMLAGIGWTHTRVLPDAAQLALYRDGDDWIGPHIDYEGLFGPRPDNVVVGIFSFGATRRMGFYKLGYSRAELEAKRDSPDHVVTLPEGSLLIMSGTTQRHWLHSIMREPELTEARISVSLIRYQEGTAGVSAMLVEAAGKGETVGTPRHVGTPEECTKAWCRIVETEGVHRSQLVGRDVPESLWPDGVDEAPDLGMVLGDGREVSGLDRAVRKFTGLEPEAPPGIDPAAFNAHLLETYGEHGVQMMRARLDRDRDY
jgi:hypothetical protein